MRDSIEQFLLIKGFKVSKVRTRILASYIEKVIDNRDVTNGERIIDMLAKDFNTNRNNITQHLFQMKKYYEQVYGKTVLAPSDLAHTLAIEFMKFKGIIA